MSLLVQKASGANSIHFASPTTPGNTVVLLIAWQGPANEQLDLAGNEGKISAGGNIFARNGSGFVYNQKQPVTDSLADTQAAIMQCPNITAISDISTPGWVTGHDRIIYAYEVKDVPLTVAAAFLGSLDSSSFTQTPSTNIDVDFFGGFSWFDEDDGVCKFDVVIATTDAGDISSVAAPWTLDTIIDSRFAAAYTESKNVLADVPVFTSTTPTNYAVNAEAIFSNDPDCAAPSCCPVADPPDGPFDDFTELDPALFLPCSTLRASTVEAINKNILEATLTPEFFAPAIYHDGDIVPLPTSPVDGYPYKREELTYLWNWNNTGPESDIRLPTFSGFVFSDTADGHVPGQVHITVWRLPAGHPPKETHEGSLRVIVIGSRQAQHPEITEDPTQPPDDGGTPADNVSGSVSFPNQSAALPPTVLFTVPGGRTGLKQISYTAKITQAAGTSSSLGGTNGAQVSYADGNDLQEVTTAPGAHDAGNLLTTVVSGTITINAAENNDVIFQFDYASVGSPAMNYTLDVAWQEV